MRSLNKEVNNIGLNIIILLTSINLLGTLFIETLLLKTQGEKITDVMY